MNKLTIINLLLKCVFNLSIHDILTFHAYKLEVYKQFECGTRLSCSKYILKNLAMKSSNILN